MRWVTADAEVEMDCLDEVAKGEFYEINNNIMYVGIAAEIHMKDHIYREREREGQRRGLGG